MTVNMCIPLKYMQGNHTRTWGIAYDLWIALQPPFFFLFIWFACTLHHVLLRYMPKQLY